MIVNWLSLGLAFGLSTLTAPVLAQSAAERAGNLKLWREQCNDPDTDLRQAYLEAAIATGDVAVQRICIRLALESDDADVQNLGLRAALAAIPSLTFKVEQPAELAAALKKAGTDKKALEDIERWYAMMNWRRLKSGLSFDITEATVNGATATWQPLAGLAAPNDRYIGRATIVGGTVSWVGDAQLQPSNCRLDATVVPGGMIEGTLQCGDVWHFPVSAKLL